MRKEERSFEKVYKNYLSIGYYNGKAIVKDELHRLYFVRCEEREAPIGTVVEENVLQPITKLNSEEQKSIQDIYGNKDE